ncbi:MAG: PAS domain-containing protein, partial [Rhodospirillales bacterium]|nr:PAS domain-containing protein [Rhodospirillales bacterium]
MFRRLLRSLPASALPAVVLAPSPAAALTVGALPLQDPGVMFLSGLLLASALTLPIVVMHRWRQAKAADDLSRVQAELSREAEVMLAAPDGFYRWSHGAGEQCSRRLAVLLGLFNGIDASFDEVLASFGQAEAAVLEVAVAGLRQNGVGFELELALRDSARRMLVMGVRAAAPDGTPVADLLWMRDVTEGATAVDRLFHQSRDLSDERDRLRAFFSALPMPVWLRDDDLALLECNAAYARAVEAENPRKAVERGLELVSGPGVREARALAARSRAA